MLSPRTERRCGGSESQSVSRQLDWTQRTADAPRCTAVAAAVIEEQRW
jgi:hypothetical protein